MQKLSVAIIYGGKSSEHEVSLKSAYGVIQAMDRDKYEIVPIGITKEGQWFTGDLQSLLGNDGSMKIGNKELMIFPDGTNSREIRIDVAFPVMHGTNAEDGAIQGLLELAGIPYVGCDIAASAVGFDKDLTKKIVSLLDVYQADYITVNKYNYKEKIKEVPEKIGFPCFVKPASQGSSVGIFKVAKEEDLLEAVEKSFTFGRKIMIEEFISGREVEISVLGNECPSASLPGEILAEAEFYDYEAKYSSTATRLKIPAEITEEQLKEMQGTAKKIYQAIGCSGLARVDFFLTHKDNRFCFNEINTMPGFTPGSMYVKMWEAAGMSYAEVLERLLKLALEK